MRLSAHRYTYRYVQLYVYQLMCQLSYGLYILGLLSKQHTSHTPLRKGVCDACCLLWVNLKCKVCNSIGYDMPFGCPDCSYVIIEKWWWLINALSFYTLQNFLWQPKSVLLLSRALFQTYCNSIFGLAQNICTGTKHFGTCRRIRHKQVNEKQSINEKIRIGISAKPVVEFSIERYKIIKVFG